MESRISRAKVITIVPNPIPMKAEKHSNPKAIIFIRLAKLVRAVNASDGNSIRKSNCTNIGRFISVAPEFSPTKRSPFDM